jgi:hypothetical protein
MLKTKQTAKRAWREFLSRNRKSGSKPNPTYSAAKKFCGKKRSDLFLYRSLNKKAF